VAEVDKRRGQLQDVKISLPIPELLAQPIALGLIAASLNGSAAKPMPCESAIFRATSGMEQYKSLSWYRRPMQFVSASLIFSLDDMGNAYHSAV
jgi:hypothetical protein